MSGKILHKCGHTSIANLSGSDELPAKRIAQLAASDCATCWLKKKQPYFFLRSDANGIVISGHNCHNIHAVLKSRGYRFQRPSWRKTLADDAERYAELLWIAEREFPLVEIPDKSIARGVRHARKN
jgi:hypothetical protein